MARKWSSDPDLAAIEKEITERYGGTPPWEAEGKTSAEWASERLAEAAKRPQPPAPWEVEGKTIEEWGAEQLALAEELGRPLQNERGRYLDMMTNIEWELARVIADHFGVHNTRSLEFTRWLDGRVGFAEKTDMIGRVIESRNLENEFGWLGKALKDAWELRNVLAHSVMEPAPEVFIFFKVSRGGDLRFHKYTLDELKAYLRRAYALNYHVLHLHGVINGDWTDIENPYSDVEF